MVGWKTQAFLLASAGSVFVTRPAAACSRPCQDPPIYLWPKQEEIPGNLIRFRVLVPEPGRLELRRRGGEVVPASVRMMGPDRVFAPLASVPAGTELTLHYDLVCGDPRRPPRDGTFTFQVGPPATVAIRPAELVVYEQGTRDPGSAYNETGFVRLSYYSPEHSGNAAHLVQSIVTLDGRPYALDAKLSTSGLPTIEVASDCMLRGSASDGDYQVDSCGGLRSVPPGTHTVEVKPHLVGEDTQAAPVKLEVTTTCPRGLVPTPAASNLKPIPLPSASPRPVRNAGEPATPVGHRATTPKSSGCALRAPVAERAPSGFFLAVAALAAAVRRRRSST